MSKTILLDLYQKLAVGKLVYIGDTEPFDKNMLWLDTKTYELKAWNGNFWTDVRMHLDASGVIVSNYPPSDTSQLWLDTNDNRLKFYNGTDWVSITDYFGIYVSDSESPYKDKLWFDTTEMKIKYYDGTKWTAIEDKIGIIVSNSPPTNATLLWFDSNSKKIKYYDGKSWTCIDAETLNGVGIDNTATSNSLWTSDKIVSELSTKADKEHTHSMSDITDYVPPVVISDTKPSETNVLWFDTTTHELKYYDVGSNTWVAIASGDSSSGGTSSINEEKLKSFSFFVGML